MNTAEIVVREVQCDGGFQVRQLLAERIGKQARIQEGNTVFKTLPSRSGWWLNFGHYPEVP
jgi:hypothetical protein